MFGISPGDSLIVLCGKDQKMAVVRPDIFESIGGEIFMAKLKQDKE